jgi:hypothetical protein
MAIRTIQLDFLHPAGRGFRVRGLLLVAGAIAVLAAVGYQRDLGRQVSVHQAELEQLRGMASRSLPHIAERDADTPELRDQIKKANGVLQQMNVPWGDLFAGIESAEDGQVALLAVQPDPRSTSVLIGGVARALPAVFAYMARLERTGRLRDVVLVSHEVKTKEPGQPVAFTLNAAWQEAR